MQSLEKKPLINVSKVGIFSKIFKNKLKKHFVFGKTLLQTKTSPELKIVKMVLFKLFLGFVYVELARRKPKGSPQGKTRMGVCEKNRKEY